MFGVSLSCQICNVKGDAVVLKKHAECKHVTCGECGLAVNSKCTLCTQGVPIVLYCSKCESILTSETWDSNSRKCRKHDESNPRPHYLCFYDKCLLNQTPALKSARQWRDHLKDDHHIPSISYHPKINHDCATLPAIQEVLRRVLPASAFVNIPLSSGSERALDEGVSHASLHTASGSDVSLSEDTSFYEEPVGILMSSRDDTSEPGSEELSAPLLVQPNKRLRIAPPIAGVCSVAGKEFDEGMLRSLMQNFSALNLDLPELFAKMQEGDNCRTEDRRYRFALAQYTSNRLFGPLSSPSNKGTDHVWWNDVIKEPLPALRQLLFASGWTDLPRKSLFFLGLAHEFPLDMLEASSGCGIDEIVTRLWRLMDGKTKIQFLELNTSHPQKMEYRREHRQVMIRAVQMMSKFNMYDHSDMYVGAAVLLLNRDRYIRLVEFAKFLRCHSFHYGPSNHKDYTEISDQLDGVVTQIEPLQQCDELIARGDSLIKSFFGFFPEDAQRKIRRNGIDV